MARDHNDTRRSGRVTVVVTEQAAQPLSALDLAFGATDFWSRFNDLVRQGLVIALTVIMKKILTNGVLQRALAEKEHPVRSNYSAGIQIGTENGFGRDIERDSQSERPLNARAAVQREANLVGSRVRRAPIAAIKLDEATSRSLPVVVIQ